MPESLAILLVGGTAGQASRLRRSLAPHFLLVESARDLAEARALRLRCHFHRLVLIDPQTPWDTLHRELEACNGLASEVLLIAEKEQAATALEALRAGVSDVLLRPFANDELVAMLSAVKPAPIHVPRPAAESRRLVGDAPSIRTVRSLIERVAPTTATVLIQGESGTGKGTVARLLHEASVRKGPFVPLDCSTIAPQLLESGLFGHDGGALPGTVPGAEGLLAGAGGGTLFLDEIHEMPLEIQAKLLRVLEEDALRDGSTDRKQPTDCRIVASTRMNLAELVAEGGFREDLNYRLNVVHIEIPPLRERRQDIPLLATHLLESLSTEMGLPPVALEPEDLARLERHDWPGNIRELRNLVERTLLLGRMPPESLGRPARQQGPPDYPLDWTLEQVKRHHMARVLEATGGNKSAAARRLAVSRKTLERKLGTTRRG